MLAIFQKVNAQVTPSCNNATIKGSYGTKFTGTVTSLGSAAGVGLVKLDGKGHFQLLQTVSNAGTISKNLAYSGTYSVKQDCTVQFVSSPFSTVSGVIVDGGKEIFMIETDPGVTITATWKKVN
jgi:hypothetical protein